MKTSASIARGTPFALSSRSRGERHATRLAAGARDGPRRPSGSELAWSIPAKTRKRFVVALKQRRRTSRSFGGARNEISRVSGYVPRRSSRTPRPVLSRSRVRSVTPSWYPTISAISSTL